MPENQAPLPRSLNELLATWQSWSNDDAVTRASQTQGRTVAEIEALRADRGHRVDPLTALAAQHELASLLSGWEWHTVRAARENGATWAQIAEATRCRPEEALDAYLAVVDEQADGARQGWLPAGFDPDPYYAAAGSWTDELHPDTPAPAVEEIEDAHAREDTDALEALRAPWWDPHHRPDPAQHPVDQVGTEDASAAAYAAAQAAELDQIEDPDWGPDAATAIADDHRVYAHLAARARSHPDAPATELHDMPADRWNNSIYRLRRGRHIIETGIVTGGDRAGNATGYKLCRPLDPAEGTDPARGGGRAAGPPPDGTAAGGERPGDATGYTIHDQDAPIPYLLTERALHDREDEPPERAGAAHRGRAAPAATPVGAVDAAATAALAEQTAAHTGGGPAPLLRPNTDTTLVTVSDPTREPEVLDAQPAHGYTASEHPDGGARSLPVTTAHLDSDAASDLDIVRAATTGPATTDAVTPEPAAAGAGEDDIAPHGPCGEDSCAGAPLEAPGFCIDHGEVGGRPRDAVAESIAATRRSLARADRTSAIQVRVAQRQRTEPHDRWPTRSVEETGPDREPGFDRGDSR